MKRNFHPLLRCIALNLRQHNTQHALLIINSLMSKSARRTPRTVDEPLLFLYQVHKIKFKYFAKIGVLGFVISIILLLLVFVIGVTVNGASRWLSIAGVQFQPSDIAKLSILLFMARQLSKYRHQIKDFKFLFLYVLELHLLVCEK